MKSPALYLDTLMASATVVTPERQFQQFFPSTWLGLIKGILEDNCRQEFNYWCARLTMRIRHEGIPGCVRQATTPN
jgi:hypothetical protein